MPELAALRTLVLSLLPGLFWLVYLRSLSGGRGPKVWHWLIALLAGWASTGVTLWVSDALVVERLQSVPYIGGPLLYFLLGVGLVEEGSKAICALVALKLPGLSNRPMLTLQLCGGVALGFATAENLLYAGKFGSAVLVGRFVSATLAHVLFSSVWGFALGGMEKTDAAGVLRYHTRWKTFAFWLLIGAGGHGLFDWFLLTDRPVLAMLSMLILWFGFREAVVGAYVHQEYQRNLPFEVMPCPHCGVLTRSKALFCSFCGESFRAAEVESGESQL